VKKFCLFSLACLQLAAWTPLEVVRCQQSLEIPNYKEVNPKVGTGGQPSSDDLHRLQELGYRAIINLRTDSEGVDLASEKKLAEDLGMRYFNIPVRGSEPRDDQAAEFLRLMEELKESRVFVHCASANRVGSFMLIQLALAEGKPLEEAEKEADAIGLRSEVLRKFAREYVAQHPKK